MDRGQSGPAVTAPGYASAPSAEVSFDVPRWFATVLEPSTTRQRLYGAGDILPDPKGVGDEYRIRRIEEGGLQLGDLPGRKAIWVRRATSFRDEPGGG